LTDEFKLGYKTTERETQKEEEGDPTAKQEALREHLKTQKQAKAKAKGGAKAKAKSAPAPAQPQGNFSQPLNPMAYMAPPQMPPMKMILPLWGSKATVKLTNVPVSYKQETLAAVLVMRFRGALDFLFLPDAKEGSSEDQQNVGFAYVNFRDQRGSDAFLKTYNKVAVATCFPVAGNQEATATDQEEKVCKVQQVKIQTLDKAVEDARQRSSSGKVTMPIMLDMWGNARPIPTYDMHLFGDSHQRAVASAHKANEMIVQAMSSSSAAMNPVRKQVEYYFSFDNLCKDVFLRNTMDGEGWVELSLIASFNMVKKHGVAAESLGMYLLGSDVVEVDNAKLRIRQKDAKQRMMMELRGAVEGKDEDKGDALKEAAKAE
jgi:hypothetical protein